jgi:hypothetical protein
MGEFETVTIDLEGMDNHMGHYEQVVDRAIKFKTWWHNEYPGEEPYCPHIAALWEALDNLETHEEAWPVDRTEL